MMRSLKSKGGITRGCDVTESVRILWANTAHRSGSIHEAITNLTGMKHISSKQHLELSKRLIKRDNNDLKAMTSWFQTHNLFDIDVEEL